MSDEAEHIYQGGCPDQFRPDDRDADCPACRAMPEPSVAPPATADTIPPVSGAQTGTQSLTPQQALEQASYCLKEMHDFVRVEVPQAVGTLAELKRVRRLVVEAYLASVADPAPEGAAEAPAPEWDQDALADAVEAFVTADDEGAPAPAVPAEAGEADTVRRVAHALAVAAGDGAFDHHDDPERWEADAEDRDYWSRLAGTALAAVSPVPAEPDTEALRDQIHDTVAPFVGLGETASDLADELLSVVLAVLREQGVTR